MSTFSCECGGNVSKQQAKGRLFSYAEYGMVRLTKSCRVLLCDSCDAYFEAANDDALTKALKASLTDNFLEILEVIKDNHPGIRESQLAFFCGLAASTFSRCKKKSTGKVIPSYAFLLLKGVMRDGVKFMDGLLDLRWEASSTSGSASSATTHSNQGYAAKSY